MNASCSGEEARARRTEAPPGGEPGGGGTITQRWSCSGWQLSSTRVKPSTAANHDNRLVSITHAHAARHVFEYATLCSNYRYRCPETLSLPLAKLALSFVRLLVRHHWKSSSLVPS